MGEEGFLGRGFGFPVTAHFATGRFEESAGEEDIRQAIFLILSTRKGERVMRPEFGCDIYNFMFGTMDSTSIHLMEESVLEALIRWEPRIRDIEVTGSRAEDADGVIEFHIHYTVRSTNNVYNMVYPFFISEGMGGE